MVGDGEAELLGDVVEEVLGFVLEELVGLVAGFFLWVLWVLGFVVGVVDGVVACATFC